MCTCGPPPACKRGAACGWLPQSVATLFHCLMRTAEPGGPAFVRLLPMHACMHAQRGSPACSMLLHTDTHKPTRTWEDQRRRPCVCVCLQAQAPCSRGTDRTGPRWASKATTPPPTCAAQACWACCSSSTCTRCVRAHRACDLQALAHWASSRTAGSRSRLQGLHHTLPCMLARCMPRCPWRAACMRLRALHA